MSLVTVSQCKRDENGGLYGISCSYLIKVLEEGAEVMADPITEVEMVVRDCRRVTRGLGIKSVCLFCVFCHVLPYY